MIWPYINFGIGFYFLLDNPDHIGMAAGCLFLMSLSLLSIALND